MRETSEEVGLELTSGDYAYLGALDDRYTMPINLKPFLIAAHGAFLRSWPDSTCRLTLLTHLA